MQKYVNLQEFCKLQTPPANCYTAFTRQRSLVRNQHRPLRNCLQNAVFRYPLFLPGLLVCSNPRAHPRWIHGGLGRPHRGRPVHGRHIRGLCRSLAAPEEDRED
jgi:hypothetical protein